MHFAFTKKSQIILILCVPILINSNSLDFSHHFRAAGVDIRVKIDRVMAILNLPVSGGRITTKLAKKKFAAWPILPKFDTQGPAGPPPGPQRGTNFL